VAVEENFRMFFEQKWKCGIIVLFRTWNLDQHFLDISKKNDVQLASKKTGNEI
jgi:hypothetical protein